MVNKVFDNMEFLCLAPTHNFPNNSKFPTICPSGHNTKTSRSRVRPLAVPLKISQLISSFNPFEPEVSTLRSLENIEPGELIVNNPTGGDKDDIQYFLDMLSSPVYDVAVESPLQQSMNISERLGVNFYMKREDRQSVFSFKLRGAYNMMSKLPDDQLSKGVITASAGNHAMGVALSAQKLKSSATIVMPVTTPEFKREAVENTGATVILRGNTFDEAHECAMTMSQDEDLTFIPPYDHPDIIKGQGTIGAEISRQFSKPVHAIFVPIGGGGLAAGIATYMKQVSPSTKIIGVEPYGACSMALSLSNGVRVKLENVDNFADGVAVGLVGEEPFRICKNLIDGMVLVDRDAISATIKDVYDEEKNILETSGALAIAGAEAYCKYYNIKNENIVAIASGANMDFSKFKSIMDLANIGAKKEALLATFMPEEPGSFKRFTQLVGSINITEFKYRFNSERKRALVLYSVDVPEKIELEEMLWRMESSEMHTVNLSNNNLVNDHLRHLIGGRSHPRHEILCQFIFPEKPGALRKFVDAFSPRWNITLFHYRDQGEVDASVLVGFQVQKWEMGEFQYHVNNLGYPYEIEIHNEAYKLIME